jgi:hypothetical protein
MLGLSDRWVPGAIHARAAVQNAGAPAATNCSLPLTHDSYDGFHVGVPAGWELSTISDTIFLTKDPSGAEAAVVYPVIDGNGLTPSSFFAAYSRLLQQSAASLGNSLSFRLVSKPGILPQAVVTGRAGRVAIQGRAVVTLLRQQTARGTSLLVYSAYWAPSNRLAADGPMLARIGRCYGSEPGTLYQVFQDQVFAFALPLGWQVTSEGQDNLDLNGDGNRARVSYVAIVPSTSDAGTTPTSFVQYIFGLDHIQIDTVLSAINLGSQQTVTGGEASGERLEFLGRYNNVAIHALVYIEISVGGSFTSGVLRVAMATPTRWNADNSGLIKVMTSIRHSMAQDNQAYQHLTQQWQKFNQTTQQFDDVLNGVEEVQDPSTGTLYAAPYDSYEVNGPDGPGYYINDGGFQQRLQPVSR